MKIPTALWTTSIGSLASCSATVKPLARSASLFRDAIVALQIQVAEDASLLVAPRPTCLDIQDGNCGESGFVGGFVEQLVDLRQVHAGVLMK